MKGTHLYEGYTLPRAALLGAMGAITLLRPEFLLGKAFYGILVGYAMLAGALLVLDTFFGKGAKTLLACGKLAAGGLLIVLGIHLTVFARYLSQVTPVFLSGLLLAEGAACLAAAWRAGAAWQRALLVSLAAATVLGGLSVFVFTFGFGVGGIVGLARVSGGALLAACACGLAECMVRRLPQGLGRKGGDGHEAVGG